MRKDDEDRAPSRWPGWAEPLRLDDVSRRRLRRQILAGAAPLLGARRDTWQDVASGWAAMLIPVAAVLLVLFTGLAYQATSELAAPPPVAAAPSMEELMAGGEAPPGVLTASVEPSADAVLTAVMSQEPLAGGQ